MIFPKCNCVPVTQRHAVCLFFERSAFFVDCIFAVSEYLAVSENYSQSIKKKSFAGLVFGRKILYTLCLTFCYANP